MSRPVHFEASRRGSVLGAPCGFSVRCTIENGSAERFTTSEDRVTCCLCKSALAASAEPDAPELEAMTPGPGVWLPAAVGTRIALPVTPMGERVERMKTWPTARAAVAAWLRWLGPGVSIASPELDWRVPRHRDPVPTGDRAHREQDTYLDTADAVLGACRTAHMLGQYEPTESQRRVVLALHVVGEPVRRHPRSAVKRTSKNESQEHAGEERRKTWIVEWEPRGEEWIGRFACRSFGLPEETVNEFHVRELVRGMLYEVGVYLKSRGRVLHGGGQEATEMGIDKSKLLVGWRAIAQHLDWSVTRAMAARAWTPPIPVRQVGEWYEADAEELDKWRQGGSKAPSGQGAA